MDYTPEEIRAADLEWFNDQLAYIVDMKLDIRGGGMVISIL